MAAIRPPLYYRVAIRLATPFYRLLVHKKSSQLAHYQSEVNARFGRAYPPVPNAPESGIIWCHAVSLGELNTAYPLLKLLMQAGFGLWITSTTQTGYARAAVLFADELANGTVQHSFVPVDGADVVAKFIEYVRPKAVLFIETELWATTLYELAKRHIPTMMVNARLTEHSYQGYAKFAKLSTSMMANLSLIIAQDAASARHFVQLGASADKVLQKDSLKWASPATLNDNQQQVLTQLKQQTHHRPIWLAASTHEGEELSALTVHRRILKIMPNALLIIVPRHPERFLAVASLCQKEGFDIARRSQDEDFSDKSVYLADSMGELMLWYGLCDVCLVGGSLVDKGGHTPIEPASVAKPIIMGQYTKNADVLVQALSEVGALVQVSDDEALFEQVKAWLADNNGAVAAGEAGKRLVEQKQNAAHEQAMAVLSLLE